MTAVLVPWQPGCPHREAAWAFLRPHWEEIGEVIEGRCTGPWVKADAVADALSRTDAQVLVIADADVWADPSEALAACQTWAVPHLKVHRLSPDSTTMVLDGADWEGLPLDSSNSQDGKPYVGQAGGGVTVIRRDIYEQVPIPKVVGWGQEDKAWELALRTLIGEPWRGTRDLVHLWHPPQPRKSRYIGSTEGAQLVQTYRRARHNRELMRLLVEQGR